jgi:hypothetical protein
VGVAPAPVQTIGAPVAVSCAPGVTAVPLTTAATLATPGAHAAATLLAAQEAEERASRRRWIAAALALGAAALLLTLIAWVWLKDRCTGDGDCAHLCPRADVPCTSRCSNGRCQSAPVSCTQPGQAWCPSRRACIDTRTEVCATPGVVVPTTPAGAGDAGRPASGGAAGRAGAPTSRGAAAAAANNTPASSGAPVGGAAAAGTVAGASAASPAAVPAAAGSPLPLPRWDSQAGAPTAGGNGMPSPLSPAVPASPGGPDRAAVAMLLPIVSQCLWQAAQQQQQQQTPSPYAAYSQQQYTVSVDGRTYVVDLASGAVRMADATGRLWDRGGGGRWWFCGSLADSDPSSPPSSPSGATTTDGEISCWDETLDTVWTRDVSGSLWAAPRTAGNGAWVACDASGASSVAPAPLVPVTPHGAAADVSVGRASANAAAAMAHPLVGSPALLSPA